MEKEFRCVAEKTQKIPDWSISVPPLLLRVDDLSRVETEKHQAEWGRVEATLSCISYLAFSRNYCTSQSLAAKAREELCDKPLENDCFVIVKVQLTEYISFLTLFPTPN